MNYKEISDKWKVFLTENAFKEDVIIKPDKKKNKKKKEIIVSEKEKCMDEGSGCMEELDEFEEFQEEESLEEMSLASAVQGPAGNAFTTKKKMKNY